jgi:hypothetical protein
MNEPTITCPNCKTGIKLTEPLIAPLIESMRREYDHKIAMKETDASDWETAIQEKQESVFRYLTGSRFNHRIKTIMEKLTDMQSDLEKERTTMMRLWAKREEQIHGLIESTVGMYGDLQGIAGKTLMEFDDLKTKPLPSGESRPEQG